MKKILIGIVLIFLVLPVFISAATYYVDASGGNNNNAGTSQSSAWKTISKVNSRSFSPGDFILFKRGETWREQLIVPSSGTQNNPITFGAYGSGNKPKILGSIAKNSVSDWTNEGSNRWYASSSIKVWNVVYDNENSWARRVISKGDLIRQGDLWYDDSNDRVYIYSMSNPATYYNGNIELCKYEHIVHIASKDYIKLENLDLRYSSSNIIWSSGDYIEVDGCTIRFAGERYSSEPSGLWSGAGWWNYQGTHTTLKNSMIRYVWTGYYAGNMLNTNYVVTIYNNDISYNIGGFSGNSGNLIAFGGNYQPDYTGSVISHNNIYEFGGRGISLSHGSHFIVEYNTVHDVKKDTPGISWQSGISMGSGGPGYQVVRYNHIYNIDIGYGGYWNSGTGIFTREARNSEVYYNVIHDVRKGIYNALGTSGGNNNNNKYYNNVLYNCTQYGIWINDGYSAGQKTSVTIKNNIVDGALADIRLGENIVCAGGFNALKNDVSVSLGTGSTYSGSANDLYQTNSLFTSLSGNDFSLQSSSPCIDAGANVGLNQDFIGSSVPQGSAPDIGAYEYGSGSPPPPPPPSSSEPVAEYHFDEGSGTTASDSSGNNNYGIIYGATWVNGAAGKALSFDGIDDDLGFGDVTELNTDTISISLWIKPMIQDGDNIFLSKGAYQDSGWYLWHNSNNGLQLRVNNAGSHEIDTAHSFFTFNEWQHIAVVFDKTKVYWYKNGVPFASNPDDDITTDWALPEGKELVIGSYETSPGTYNFNGIIDEVKIYNRALTSQEINDLYNEIEITVIPGDVDNDSDIDFNDLILVARDFGKTSGFNSRADTNTDGEVDIFDVVFVASKI